MAAALCTVHQQIEERDSVASFDFLPLSAMARSPRQNLRARLASLLLVLSPLALTQVLLLTPRGAEAHLADSCPSVVQNTDVYTRNTGTTTQWSGMMYFWTASYSHGNVQGTGLQSTGSGCYSKNYRKIYFRDSGTSYPGCNGGDGDATVLWDNGQKTTWASGLTAKNSDKPSERPHCNTNINFMKFWHLVGKGFRLPDYYTETGTSCNTASSTNGCDKPLYVSLCFSGFMCEATQVEVGLIYPLSPPPPHPPTNKHLVFSRLGVESKISHNALWHPCTAIHCGCSSVSF